MLRHITQNDINCAAMLAWKATVDIDIANLAGRAALLEANDFSGLVSRVADLESWRASKESAIADLSFTVSSSSVDILGIQVPTAAAFTGHTNAINSLKSTVNSILAAMRSREVIAT